MVARRVDVGPEIDGWSPGVVQAAALFDVDVAPTETARTIRAEVQAQPIFRDRRMLIIGRGVDDRPKIDRHGPRGPDKSLHNFGLGSQGPARREPYGILV